MSKFNDLVNAYSMVLNKNKLLTDEMIQYSKTRTDKHIKAVQNNCKKLASLYRDNKFFSKVLNLPKEDDVIYELFGDIPYDHRANSECFLDEFEVWYEDEDENKFELIIEG
jgi:hypothetical protein